MKYKTLYLTIQTFHFWPNPYYSSVLSYLYGITMFKPGYRKDRKSQRHTLSPMSAISRTFRTAMFSYVVKIVTIQAWIGHCAIIL